MPGMGRELVNTASHDSSTRLQLLVALDSTLDYIYTPHEMRLYFGFEMHLAPPEQLALSTHVL